MLFFISFEFYRLCGKHYLRYAKAKMKLVNQKKSVQPMRNRKMRCCCSYENGIYRWNRNLHITADFSALCRLGFFEHDLPSMIRTFWFFHNHKAMKELISRYSALLWLFISQKVCISSVNSFCEWNEPTEEILTSWDINNYKKQRICYFLHRFVILRG